METQVGEKKVQVLLSTYNGERFLREQLDSIVEQSIRPKILIRDDGSNDNTRAILQEFASEKDIHVIYGENQGAINSFFSLMNDADSEADYVALADQDDVWKNDRLSRAVEWLNEAECRYGKSTPLVYCSHKTLVDENLKPMSSAIQYKNVRTEFGNALVENMCTGCTCVMNQALINHIRGRVPEFTVMHDFWIYLVGTCFGYVLYDEESRILYRQHSKNAVGAETTILKCIVRRIKRFNSNRGVLTRQAKEFWKIYQNEMPEEKRELLQTFIAAKTDKTARRKLLKESRIFRQTAGDCFIMRIVLRLGLL